MQESVFRAIAHSSLVVYIVVLIWLLYSLRRMVRNQATRYLYATLSFWLLLAAKDIAYLFGDTWYDPQVTNILMSIDSWPTPIVAILLLYALQPRWLNRWRIVAMVSPFFAFTILNIILKGNELLFLANQIYTFAFATIFGAIILILAFKCDLYINANYSDKRQVDVKWVRFLIILAYAISVQSFFLRIEPTWLGDAVFYLSTIVLSISLFSFMFRHKEVIFPDYMNFRGILSDTRQDGVETDSSIMLRQFAEIEAKLEVAIHREKVYLNPQLSLTDLANHIGTNRTYLSRYINNYKATPFINYINDFRCEEAQRLLSDSAHTLTMVELSERSGFASYSTFRRVFKQKYGYAPSQVRP